VAERSAGDPVRAEHEKLEVRELSDVLRGGVGHAGVRDGQLFEPGEPTYCPKCLVIALLSPQVDIGYSIKKIRPESSAHPIRPGRFRYRRDKCPVGPLPTVTNVSTHSRDRRDGVALDLSAVDHPGKTATGDEDDYHQPPQTDTELTAQGLGRRLLWHFTSSE
jgi:hypothetical protein